VAPLTGRSPREGLLNERSSVRRSLLFALLAITIERNLPQCQPTTSNEFEKHKIETDDCHYSRYNTFIIYLYCFLVVACERVELGRLVRLRIFCFLSVYLSEPLHAAYLIQSIQRIDSFFRVRPYQTSPSNLGNFVNT
jgi:hypothetical protein